MSKIFTALVVGKHYPEANAAGESTRMLVGSNGIGFHNQTHPNNVHATQVLSNSITWSWDVLPGISSYGLGLTDDSGNIISIPSPTTDTTYTATGLNLNATYGLIVYGIYDNGLSNGDDCYSCWANQSEATTVNDTDPPTISVIGAPLNWQYTDASANVNCSDSITGCNSSTFRLKKHTDSGGSCPTNYNDYNISYLPKNVTAHAWYCATGKDNAGNVGFSPTRVEFKVDKIGPKVDSLSLSSSSICSGTSIRISWTSSDTGWAGVNRVEA